MPCYDPRDKWDDEHNNVAAELLCCLLTLRPELAKEFPNLEAWWKDHQNRDAMYARRQNER